MVSEDLTVYISCMRLEIENSEVWAQGPQIVSSNPVQRSLKHPFGCLQVAGQGFPGLARQDR